MGLNRGGGLLLHPNILPDALKPSIACHEQRKFVDSFFFFHGEEVAGHAMRLKFGTCRRKTYLTKISHLELPNERVEESEM